MLISKFASDNVDVRLKEYEKIIGKRLPNQYRQFILKYNGGETPNTSYKINGVSSDLRVLYGLGNEKYPLDLIRTIGNENQEYLAIGCDSFGNEIFIDIVKGAIYFGNHENGKITKLTSDFKTFINICESKKINSASMKSVEERENDLIKRGRGNIITEELRNMWRAEIAKNSLLKLEEIDI